MLLCAGGKKKRTGDSWNLREKFKDIEEDLRQETKAGKCVGHTTEPGQRVVIGATSKGLSSIADSWCSLYPVSTGL